MVFSSLLHLLVRRNNSILPSGVTRTSAASESHRSTAADARDSDTFVAAARVRGVQPGSPSSVAEMKARQAAKMREIREALIAEGYVSLDDQAAALGLSRSTTWTIMKGNHKSSGLSATVVNRMLSAPRLQASVRKKILEYVAEKSGGHYGNGKEQLRKFVGRLKGSENRMSDRSND